MNEFEAAIHIPWDELLKWVATGIFAALLWMLKQFGNQHIASVKELAIELREMRREINALSERVKIVEVVQKHYHHEERRE